MIAEDLNEIATALEQRVFAAKCCDGLIVDFVLVGSDLNFHAPALLTLLVFTRLQAARIRNRLNHKVPASDSLQDVAHVVATGLFELAWKCRDSNGTGNAL